MYPKTFKNLCDWRCNLTHLGPTETRKDVTFLCFLFSFYVNLTVLNSNNNCTAIITCNVQHFSF